MGQRVMSAAKTQLIDVRTVLNVYGHVDNARQHKRHTFRICNSSENCINEYGTMKSRKVVTTLQLSKHRRREQDSSKSGRIYFSRTAGRPRPLAISLPHAWVMFTNAIVGNRNNNSELDPIPNLRAEQMYIISTGGGICVLLQSRREPNELTGVQKTRSLAQILTAAEGGKLQ